MTAEKKHTTTCRGCGLTFNCVCDGLPSLEADWDLVLLTHPNETRRETNTGQWLHKSLAQCQVFEWSRTRIPAELKTMLENPNNQPILLFPSDSSRLLTSAAIHDNSKRIVFIVLDGTWQEAQKMYNRSDWLQSLPHWHIQMSGDSCYSLRRNQASGHFCTLEVGIHLLSLSHHTTLPKQNNSEPLKAFFEHYLNVYRADKSGHPWKGSNRDQ
ncbi:DTW domain-containing protein [Vibrio sp. S9_S30]|uniref:tRNA-uridine aminocarboxypropyltransferase n=1 Tax=Vibrio sp. S9_S30 TaxID=2720226 RepID=UPI00168144DA|nr:DTW domain-containing protein [Vibrio sp. S9_S30]MBD1559342.1 DTW domain-containing protein [Vibrio sp. S9_S30]